MPIKIALGVLLVFIAAQALVRVVAKATHRPVPAPMGHVLDSRLRRRFQPPERIVERYGLRTGMRVLEVGCGSGFLTTVAARRVSPAGRVIALDLQDSMLQQLRQKLRRPEHADIGNVCMVRASAHDLPFRDDALDLVYMSGVLGEVPDRARALREVGRVLKAGHVLAVTELLPDPHYSLPSTTARLGREAGLAVEAAEGSLWLYTVRFRKEVDAAR
jgi:ubiquinone/menaquinone biosynthesis C-methylase UbiE